MYVNKTVQHKYIQFTTIWNKEGGKSSFFKMLSQTLSVRWLIVSVPLSIRLIFCVRWCDVLSLREVVKWNTKWGEITFGSNCSQL